MKSTEKKSINQLEKYSAVFMQLGLVLTLFIVFVALEHKTIDETTISCEGYSFVDAPYQLADNIPIIIVKDIPETKPLKPKRKNPKVIIEEIIPINNKEIETIMDITPVEKSDVNFIDNLPTEEEPEKINDTEVSFLVIEDAPVFKGCENLSKEASRKCFTRKITKFIQVNFNSDLAQDLGLKQGKQKIYSQFLIEKNGLISEIKIRAPHKRLEKEVRRVINKIPQFIPGKQRGRPVKVKYTLPITFQVY